MATPRCSQFFCGFSGQTLVDDMTAAGFNVIFTSLPIMLFSVLDRQVGDTSYMAYPQTYNKRSMLGTLSFWRRAILHGVLDGVCSFAVPYLAVNNTDGMSRGGLYCLSKTCFFALLGTVTLEVIMMTKYWTWLFAVVIAASYLLAYAFVLVFPLIGILMGWPDPAQQGIAATLFSSPSFYLTILAANMSTMGFRMYVFWMRSLVKPSDTEIVAAREKQPCPWSELSRQTRDRLAGLSMHVVDCPEAVGNAEPGPSGNVGKPCATPQHKAVPTAQAGWKDTEMNRPSSSSALLP